MGNVVNRVFDSAGPEGKVRGTPQQIIEKYQTLARDAQLSGDRIAAENFLQHSEHYSRMLGEAQREQAERQAQDQQGRQQQSEQRRDDQQGGSSGDEGGNGLSTMDVNGSDEGASDLVETPESTSGEGKAPRSRGTRTRRSSRSGSGNGADTDAQTSSEPSEAAAE